MAQNTIDLSESANLKAVVVRLFSLVSFPLHMENQINLKVILTLPGGKTVEQSFDMEIPEATRHHGNIPRAQPEAPSKGKLALGIRETGEVLGLSYASVYRLVQRGKLRTIRGIRHKKIPLKEIERLLVDCDSY